MAAMNKIDDAHVAYAASPPDGAAWARIASLLEAALERVTGEIRRYPAPIPACDAHFNHLLAERTRISEELARLREVALGRVAPAAVAPALAQLLAQAGSLDESAKQEIRTLLG